MNDFDEISTFKLISLEQRVSFCEIIFFVKQKS